ncbi:MAG: hypothetical protein HY247_02500 [archaeon]|nr:MAG: hypothetical protein HY247_02500 [archaeon]
MSSIERAARILKTVKDEEWRTLAALERIATSYGSADRGRLSRSARLPQERVSFAVQELVKKGLAQRRGEGFALRQEGVEVMALRDYVKKDLIFALGPAIAKGKESDVYEAVTEEGTRYALKFYKIGRTSFKQVRRRRQQEGGEIKNWVTANYEAARKEYEALKDLGGLSPSFPEVISYSRSTVLSEQLTGVRLSQRPDLVDARSSEASVFEAMRKAYLVAELINADLSEYNILTDGERVWLIDWPQAVRANHPNASEYLKHDVEAVATFFRRAFDVEMEPAKALAYVRGEASALE